MVWRLLKKLGIKPPYDPAIPLLGIYPAAAAAAAKSLQSCPTLCDPMNSSPPGSSISGILQARTLEWVAISFSIAWKWKVKVKSLSRVQLFATPWTAAHQAPLPMEFSRQEYWSEVPLPSSRYIPWGNQNWKIHMYPIVYYSTWMDKGIVIRIQNGILLSHKRNTFELVLMRCINLETIIQSEVSQKGKDRCCILMHIYGI